MITCVLLSAGSSRRFGSPKALALLNGETVMCRLQTMLIDTQVDEIVVVLGDHAENIKPHLLNHDKVKFVYNKDHNLGQTSSFKAGLLDIHNESRGVLLLPVDYPLVQKATVDALIKYFLDHDTLITVPSFKGKKGHPPLFSACLKDEFLALDNGYGLNMIARQHKKETVPLPVEDPGVVSAFNTPDEFKAIQGLA